MDVCLCFLCLFSLLTGLFFPSFYSYLTITYLCTHCGFTRECFFVFLQSLNIQNKNAFHPFIYFEIYDDCRWNSIDWLLELCSLELFYKSLLFLKKKAFFCQTFYDTSLFGNHFLSSVVLWIIRCVLFYLAFFIGFQNRTTTRRGASYWSSACMLLEPPSLFLNGWAPKDWTGAPPLWEVTER